MVKKKIHLFLFLILFLSAFLRLFNLTSSPPGFGRDEASIGYNAYSILTTGRDEYGRLFPVSFEAFGDWKLPVNIYLTVPFIWLLGLNVLAVRLPVALCGIITVLLVYLLIKKITQNETIGLLTAFLLSISPWHIYMSRVGFGHNTVALTLFLFGVLLFLKNNKWDLSKFLALLFFTLTIFTYASFIFFTIPFVFFLFWKSLKNSSRKKALPFFILFIFLILLSLNLTLTANLTKVTGTSLTSDKSLIYWQVEKKQNEHTTGSFNAKFLHNKYSAIFSKFVINYQKTFSPQFLWEKGGENPINNLEEMGNLYIFEFFLLIFGAIYLIKKDFPGKWFILIWLLLSPLSSALTKDAPHSNRALVLLPALLTIEALGILEIKEIFRKPGLLNLSLLKKLFVIIFFAFSFYNFILFLDYYFVHFPKNRQEIWNSGLFETASLVNKIAPQKVIMTGIYDYYYIYFLFYDKYPPLKFQKEQQRGPLTSDGFHPVERFGKFEFVENLNWSKKISNKNTLYISGFREIPANYPVNGYIKRPNGEIAFGWIYEK